MVELIYLKFMCYRYTSTVVCICIQWYTGARGNTRTHTASETQDIYTQSVSYMFTLTRQFDNTNLV